MVNAPSHTQSDYIHNLRVSFANRWALALLSYCCTAPVPSILIKAPLKDTILMIQQAQPAASTLCIYQGILPCHSKKYTENNISLTRRCLHGWLVNLWVRLPFHFILVLLTPISTCWDVFVPFEKNGTTSSFFSQLLPLMMFYWKYPQALVIFYDTQPMMMLFFRVATMKSS